MKLKTDYNYNRGLSVLKKASKSFPNGSGVYKFIDSSESIIYIGKAKNLRKRISSYSIDNKQTRRIKTLISLTNKLEFIKTPTEIDSLILENNLIKKVKPPFNIRLMDDKSFPFIMINKNQKWPRIRKYRGKQTSDNIFFGPFANVSVVDEVLQQLEKAFLIRSCSDNIFNSRKRPCILHQIKRCSAPCVGKIKTNEYTELVKQAVLFLKGKNHNLKNMETHVISHNEKKQYNNNNNNNLKTNVEEDTPNNKKDTSDSTTSKINCVICLDNIDIKSTVALEQIKCLPCGHVFHECCIEEWFTSKRNNAFSNEEVKLNSPVCRHTAR